jgi:hypothetical protein
VRRAFVALRVVVLAAALAAAFLPLPASIVEDYYSDGFYPTLQPWVTTWSNTTGIALFDALIGVVAIGLLTAWIRWLRQSLRERSPRPAGRGLLATAVIAAAMYLWFLVFWGFNYSRSPLENVVGYDASRVTPQALIALAERAADEVNRHHDSGHAAGFGAGDQRPPALVQALHQVEQELGRPRPTVPSRPKRSLLALFFRAAGVDGMHAPFLLETLLNPDLTPPERPAVLAHEWAHLAGYAPEDDASFVGLLAALRADPGSQYSGWLALFHDVVSQLPVPDQRRLIMRLAPGPQADRRAIAARLQSRVEPVARASWETYDRYLKSQGVREGVQSYSRVVQLILGSGALDRARAGDAAAPGQQPAAGDRGRGRP